MGERLPNFLHLGPGKSGSTWLHETMSGHPQVHLSPAKDLYYFSRYYDRGAAWYRRQFSPSGPDQCIVGEVCPDYLAAVEAAPRIRETLGEGVRLMATLRNPAERAFSSFLYLRKHGLAQATFRDTARARPELLEEGRYGTQLRRYLRCFPQEGIRVAVFDDFTSDPEKFYDATTDWLGIDRQPLTDEQLEARLPASRARFLPIAWAAQRTAEWLRGHDGADLVGRVKRSPVVQRWMYVPLGDDRPQMSDADVAFVREALDAEVDAVECDFGLSLKPRWSWD